MCNLDQAASQEEICAIVPIGRHGQVTLRRHWQEMLQEFMSKHAGHCFFLHCTKHPCYTVAFTPPQEFLEDPARVFVNATVNDQPMRFSVADLVETPCRLKLDVTGNGCCKCPACQQDMTLNNPVIDWLDFAHVARMMRVDAVMPASKREVRELMRCAQCGKAKPKSKCSGCLCVRYCSEGCQKEHWKEHKPICSLVKALKLSLNRNGSP